MDSQWNLWNNLSTTVLKMTHRRPHQPSHAKLVLSACLSSKVVMHAPFVTHAQLAKGLAREFQVDLQIWLTCSQASAKPSVRWS